MNLFEELAKWQRKRVGISVNAVDQISNDKGSFYRGSMPLITYTVFIDIDGEEIYTESVDSYEEALIVAFNYLEENHSDLEDFDFESFKNEYEQSN